MHQGDGQDASNFVRKETRHTTDEDDIRWPFVIVHNTAGIIITIFNKLCRRGMEKKRNQKYPELF